MLSQELYQVFKTAFDRKWTEGELRSHWAYIWPYLKENFEEASYTDSLAQLIDGLKREFPIQYLVGYAVFFDMELEVTPHVLIPRPETEELVYQVVKYLRKTEGRQRVLDVGTGSGCIPIALGRQCEDVVIDACDISSEAIEVAKRNAQKYYPNITFFESDLSRVDDFDQRSGWDVIVSNPPYIEIRESHKMSPSTKHEPDIALFSPVDATWAYRHLCTLGKSKLKPQGRIFLELNEFLAGSIKNIFMNNHFKDVEIILDMQGKERILTATKV